jgi:hypothetical protein
MTAPRSHDASRTTDTLLALMCLVSRITGQLDFGRFHLSGLRVYQDLALVPGGASFSCGIITNRVI